MNASDGQKHVARVKRARSAGASRGCLYPLIVQEQKEGFSLNSFKTEIDVAGKTFYRVSVKS